MSMRARHCGLKIGGLNVGCLSVATLSLLTAFPLVAAAQEEAQPTQAQPEPSPAVQRVFVSDKLVLNVFSEPNQAGSRVATIETGDAVDELERADNFVHIRLEDGREGWVGSNYLTSNAPAAVQLRELQRQQKSAGQTDKKSADEIARLKKESEALQAQVKELKAEAASAPPASEAVTEEPAQQPPEQLATTATTNAGGAAWLWSLVVVLVAGLAYAAGHQTLARRIRKKFGGLRIY